VEEEAKPVLLLGQLAESSITKYQNLADSATLHRLLMVHRTATLMDSARESWTQPLSPDGCLCVPATLGGDGSSGGGGGSKWNCFNNDDGSDEEGEEDKEDYDEYAEFESSGVVAAKCADEGEPLAGVEGSRMQHSNSTFGNLGDLDDLDEKGENAVNCTSEECNAVGNGDAVDGGADADVSVPNFSSSSPTSAAFAAAAAATGRYATDDTDAIGCGGNYSDTTSSDTAPRSRKRRRNATTSSRPIRLKLSPQVAAAVNAATAAAEAAAKAQDAAKAILNI